MSDSFLRPLRSLTITYSKSDLLGVLLIASAVTVGIALGGGGLSARAFLSAGIFFLACYLVGSCFASLRGLASGVLFDLPLRLLVGYGVINTALLLLAWLSPLGIVANFAALLALVAAVWLAAGKRERVRGNSTSLGVVALCLVATALWCQDSLRPRSEQGDMVLFKPWVDGFYHAVHVRIFGASQGAASIEDWRLAGVTARPYHYGMYMLPAFVKEASGIDSYTAFAAVLAPVGVFFTGLAAYAFMGSLWGAWPGLTAAAALLLLPDGAQQGVGNTFMSYHWLTQISPSATYGLALLAVTWLFVIQGCRRGSRLQLGLGWSFAAITLVYKLHYVVASALLLLIVPASFFRGRFGVKKRAVAVVAAVAAYALALVGAQKVPGVPLIRLDGSSVGEILRLVQTFAKPGPLRDYLAQHLGAKMSTASNLLFGIPYVLLAVFGLLLPLFFLLVILLRRRTSRICLFFPLLLIGNFVVMFFGLALDFASSTPDELSHRPLMVVYFFVVSWLGGALGLALLRWRRTRGLARPTIIAFAALLLVVPARLGPGVQQLQAMPQMSPVRLPSSLVRIADFIREQGGAEDVVQDSQFDRIYALAALSERRTFVAHTLTRMPFRADIVQARTEAVYRFMSIRQPKAISATARAFGFRWFLLQPGDRVKWPAEIADEALLVAGPYKLYRF